uniref:Uncharacterized protein n=1 Tax=uncultured marine virus TaxID=186617 RepID=A0A0F7L801_9VIRU|nr:hypothetical protein [uncultured marine virus]
MSKNMKSRSIVGVVPPIALKPVLDTELPFINNLGTPEPRLDTSNVAIKCIQVFPRTVPVFVLKEATSADVAAFSNCIVTSSRNLIK